MLLSDTYRNSTLYKQGTETFRSSSTKLWSKGVNLQNIPKELRKLYIADKGKLLIQVDQAGAEALIVAYLCKPGKYRELFLNNVKPHVFVALHVFLSKWLDRCKDIDVKDFITTPIAELKNKNGWKQLDRLIKDSDDWQPSERYYFIAKCIVHASNFSMQAPTFQLSVLDKSRGAVIISKREAEDYLSNYHAMFPEIRDWHMRVDSIIDSTSMPGYKCLYNLFGYPRYFTRALQQHNRKEIYAFAPQSTVGCITHRCIASQQSFIERERLDWDNLMNGHDSAVDQAPEEEAMECAKILKGYMEQELTSPFGEKFKMKAEVKIGYNLAPYKEFTNPNGLKEIKFDGQ